MFKWMKYLKQKMVVYSALIHDGVLVHKDFTSKIDINDLSAHVCEENKIKCSFADKLQKIDKEAIEYKTLIEESVEEMEFARKKFKLSRPHDTNCVRNPKP